MSTDSSRPAADVGPDGGFLMRRPVGDSRASIEVALNWITGVRARLERDQ